MIAVVVFLSFTHLEGAQHRTYFDIKAVPVSLPPPSSLLLGLLPSFPQSAVLLVFTFYCKYVAVVSRF